MVDTIPVESADHFVTVCGEQEDNDLNASQCRELYELWERYSNERGECYLILVPEWFSSKEFGARRPYTFADVEHDDPSSGAVLFGDSQMVDISLVENESTDAVELDFAVEQLDISEDDDYIDEGGLVWIPRSLLTCFKRS